MGSSGSKLKKKLVKGDETAALSLFDTNKDLHKKFDPNVSYGDRYNHDSALHLVARHSMHRLLRLFLFEYDGNPNKKNGNNESSLHCACQFSGDHTNANKTANEQCVNMLLNWRGSLLTDGTHEKLDVAAQDKLGNTALHYAAQAGLMSCVKLLIELGAPMFVENNASQTPCEMAEKASMINIAQYLESKMVFYNNDDSEHSGTAVEEELGTDDIIREESYQGLRPQELQEAKDSLIVETSDMLRVPLFTAEVLLRHHKWSREVLLEAWIVDPVKCCEISGIVPPENLNDVTGGDHELNIMTASSANRDFTPTTCEICFDDIVNEEDSFPMMCEHSFCQTCWTDYLNIKIKEGDAHNIICPAIDCNILVPVEFIESKVSTNMAKRYLQFDIKAFVAGNPQLVWCPHPGCGSAIQNPQRDRSESISSAASSHSRSQQYQSFTAHCSNGHAFCWMCQMEPHDPASCEDYKNWLNKIAQMKTDEFKDINKQSESAANVFWMLSNSKKCPHCKSPIEKNEGCNHMKCSKCKHDFCWVCLEPWKLHNSLTGGFFRCTRFEVVEKVDEHHKSEVSSASEKHQALQELNRFVHYYSRYENHKRSLELEHPLLDQAQQKMAQLISVHTLQREKALRSASTSSFELQNSSLTAAKFIEEAISVLIKARQFLQFTYVFGYYLKDNNVKRMVFELLQTELEEKTEYLSEIVARPYLRTPKEQIVKTTKQLAEKTEEFLSSLTNGLLPQGNKGGITPSPFIRNRKGSSSGAWLSDSDDDSSDESTSRRGLCRASNCNKPRLKHSSAPNRHHYYCSLSCLKKDYLSKAKRKSKSQGTNRQIDLLQALEMSRLQLLQDMDSLTTGSSSDASGDDEGASLRQRLGINVTDLPPDPILEHVLRLSQSDYTENQDDDLSLAIAMSLQTADEQRQTIAERALPREYNSPSTLGSAMSGSSSARPPASNPTNLSTNSLGVAKSESVQVAVGDTSYSDESQMLYQARLAELDRAIADLLEESPNTDTIRRTGSDRRSRVIDEETLATSSNANSHPIRRTRSERRSSRKSQQLS